MVSSHLPRWPVRYLCALHFMQIGDGVDIDDDVLIRPIFVDAVARVACQQPHAPALLCNVQLVLALPSIRTDTMELCKVCHIQWKGWT